MKEESINTQKSEDKPIWMIGNLTESLCSRMDQGKHQITEDRVEDLELSHKNRDKILRRYWGNSKIYKILWKHQLNKN